MTIKIVTDNESLQITCGKSGSRGHVGTMLDVCFKACEIFCEKRICGSQVGIHQILISSNMKKEAQEKYYKNE